jgi:hypothetical protein
MPKMALRRSYVRFHTRFLRRTHPFGGFDVTLMNLWRLGADWISDRWGLGRGREVLNGGGPGQASGGEVA